MLAGFWYPLAAAAAATAALAYATTGLFSASAHSIQNAPDIKKQQLAGMRRIPLSTLHL